MTTPPAELITSQETFSLWGFFQRSLR